MSKSMTEAYHAWLKANPDAAGWQEGPPYWDAFAAGAAHGAAEEREANAQVCEDLVTFAEEHDKYAPDDVGVPCGWCDGLEMAAERIRQRGEK